MIIREIAEEFLDHCFLIVCEIRNIVEFMDVTQIGKEQFGIYHVLIYIVKIGKEELPPTVKVIEGLINACACYEYLVQVADRLDWVSNLQVGVSAEEVADGDVCGSPDRLAGQLRQIGIEEECCTLVWKTTAMSLMLVPYFASISWATVFKNAFIVYCFLLSLHFFYSSIILLLFCSDKHTRGIP